MSIIVGSESENLRDCSLYEDMRRPKSAWKFIDNIGTCESFFFRSNRISNRIGRILRKP